AGMSGSERQFPVPNDRGSVHRGSLSAYEHHNYAIPLTISPKISFRAAINEAAPGKACAQRFSFIRPYGDRAMYLSRIRVHNFRNFSNLDVALCGNIVIVGENRVGKSNLLYALRLIFDPTLPDSARTLSLADFW